MCNSILSPLYALTQPVAPPPGRAVSSHESPQASTQVNAQAIKGQVTWRRESMGVHAQRDTVVKGRR
jgi:hypothetical protein